MRGNRPVLSGHEEIAVGAEVAAVSPYRENGETKKPPLQAGFRITGAAGLEPATPGFGGLPEAVAPLGYAALRPGRSSEIT
jgi:hypothetical protein